MSKSWLNYHLFHIPRFVHMCLDPCKDLADSFDMDLLDNLAGSCKPIFRSNWTLSMKHAKFYINFIHINNMIYLQLLTALPPFSAHLALLPHGLFAHGLWFVGLGGGLEFNVFNVGLNEELLITTASLGGLCLFVLNIQYQGIQE